LVVNRISVESIIQYCGLRIILPELTLFFQFEKCRLMYDTTSWIAIWFMYLVGMDWFTKLIKAVRITFTMHIF